MSRDEESFVCDVFSLLKSFALLESFREKGWVLLSVSRSGQRVSLNVARSGIPCVTKCDAVAMYVTPCMFDSAACVTKYRRVLQVSPSGAECCMRQKVAQSGACVTKWH